MAARTVRVVDESVGWRPESFDQLYRELWWPMLRLATGLVDRLVTARSFDAVPDLAEVLPVTWVPDLLGWPVDGRERLLDWAGATFDCLGPLNDRVVAAPLLPRLWPPLRAARPRPR